MSASASAWPSFLSSLLGLAVPSRCIACERPRRDAGGGGVCAACWNALPRASESCPRCALPGASGECADCRRDPPPVERAAAAGVYAGPLARIVVAYKFRGFDTLAAPAARAIAAALAREGLPAPDALVPVPSTRRRNRERGYDPALLLARSLARFARRPVRRLVKRVRETAPQSRLSAAERRFNLEGAFAARPGAAGRHLLLVDDVATTGATAFASARALREAGAARVDLAVLARTPQPEDFRDPEIS